MDYISWNKERYINIVEKVGDFFKWYWLYGYNCLKKKQNLILIPVSGMSGENLYPLNKNDINYTVMN